MNKMQKELSPQVSLTGHAMASSQKQFVTRKYVTTVLLASGVKDVKTTDITLPEGCKILRFVARNLTGRTLTVNIPGETPLLIPSANKTDTSVFTQQKRYSAAPLSKFPVISAEIPDLLAAPFDPGSALTLFTVGSAVNSQSSDTVEITYTVRYAL
jgi:hypothetical protein